MSAYIIFTTPWFESDSNFVKLLKELENKMCPFLILGFFSLLPNKNFESTYL